MKSQLEEVLYNARTLTKSARCGCYACLKLFSSEVVKKRLGKALLCPYCSCDTVIVVSAEEGISYLNLVNLNTELVLEPYLRSITKK